MTFDERRKHDCAERIEAMRISDHLELLTRLASTLTRSRSALLTSDLAATERCTADQKALLEDFRESLRRGRWKEGSMDCTGRDSQERLAVLGEVRARESAALAALRLQLALLRKSRHRLTVLANMLSGLSSDYKVPTNGDAEFAPTVAWKRWE